MQLLGADEHINTTKGCITLVMSSNNRLVWNNLQNLSLNPSVPPFFLSFSNLSVSQKEGRGKDNATVPCRAGTITHTPQTISCSDTRGPGATAARTSFHTQHMLLATEVIQLLEAFPALEEGMLNSPQTSLKLQGFPMGSAAVAILLQWHKILNTRSSPPH